MKKSIFYLVPGFLILLCINCRLRGNIPIELSGNYRIFSGDTSLSEATGGENNFLEVKNDNTITYHAASKNSQEITISGDFKFNKENKTLTIHWQDNKLPTTLKIEKTGNDKIIWIKERAYVKEKI